MVRSKPVAHALFVNLAIGLLLAACAPNRPDGTPQARLASFQSVDATDSDGSSLTAGNSNGSMKIRVFSKDGQTELVGAQCSASNSVIATNFRAPARLKYPLPKDADDVLLVSCASANGGVDEERLRPTPVTSRRSSSGASTTYAEAERAAISSIGDAILGAIIGSKKTEGDFTYSESVTLFVD